MLTAVHGWHDQLDQVRGSREILGGQRVADRIGHRTIVFVPLARAPVQGRYLIRLLRHQVHTKNIGKKMVIAVPVALVIQRNDKEVASLQGFQSRVAFLFTGDGITQRAIQPIENGGLEQESADRFGLTLQNLFDQIVHDVPVVSSEFSNEPGNVLVALHGKRS